MSEFSLSYVICQWWIVRVFTDLPYFIQYYVIHLCVHLIGELCSFITVYKAKMYESGISARQIYISFFQWKKVIWTFNCRVPVLAMSEFLRIYPIGLVSSVNSVCIKWLSVWFCPDLAKSGDNKIFTCTWRFFQL